MTNQTLAKDYPKPNPKPTRRALFGLIPALVAAIVVAPTKANPTPRPTPDRDRQLMLGAFARVKAKIGDRAYSRILASNGYRTPDQIADRPTARRLWREMESCRQIGAA